MNSSDSTDISRGGWLRWLLAATGAAAALLVVALVLLQLPAAGTPLANFVLTRIEVVPRAVPSVGSARLRGLAGLELRDLRLARGDTVFVAVDTVHAGLRPWSLLAGRIHLSNLELAGAHVAGSLLAATRKPASDGPGPQLAEVLHGRFYGGPPLRADAVTLRRGSFGPVRFAGLTEARLTDVSLRARDARLGDGFAVRLDSLTIRGGPADTTRGGELFLAAVLAGGRLEVERLRLSGPGSAVAGRALLDVGATDSLQAAEIDLRADPFDLSDLTLLFPDLNARGDLFAEVSLAGPRIEQLSGHAKASLEDAVVQGRPVLAASLDVTFTDGELVLSGSGAGEAADGSLTGRARPFDDRPPYEFMLRVRRTSEHLQGLPWWETLVLPTGGIARLHVAGEGIGNADLRFDGDVRTGASRVAFRGGIRRQPEFEWEMEQLALENLDLAEWTGSQLSSSVSLSLAASGRGTDLDSLYADASWQLAPSQIGSWEIDSGEGSLALRGSRASAGLEISSAAGSVFADDVSVRLGAVDHLRLSSIRFEHFDLAGITGRSGLESDLNATLDAEASLADALTAEDVRQVEERAVLTGQLTLAPSTLRGQAIRSGQMQLELHDGRLALRAETKTDAGALALDLEGRPFDAPARFALHEARVQDLDAKAWAVSPVPTRLNAALHGALQILPESEGRWSPLGVPADWSATLELEPSTVGAVRLDAGGGDFSQDADSLRGRLRIRSGAGDAVVYVGASAGEQRVAGRALADIPFGFVAALAGQDTLTTSGEVQSDARFGGTFTHLDELEAVLRGRGSVAEWDVDTLHAVVALEEKAIAVRDFAFRSDAVEAEAEGRIVLPDGPSQEESDFRLRASILDAEPLAALLGADTLSLGDGDIELRLTGRPSARHIAARGELRSLAWNQLRVLGVNCEVRGRLDANWRPDSLTGAFSLSQLQRSLLQIQELSGEGSYADRMLAFRSNLNLDDHHSATVSGTARRDSSGVVARLDAFLVQLGPEQWNLERATTLELAADRVVIDSLEVRSDTGYVLARGRLTRRGEEDFEIQIRDFDLDLLTGWTALADVDGMLDGGLTVTGTAEDPRADGSLRVVFVSSEGPAGTAEAHLNWASGESSFGASFASPAGDSLTVLGHLPLTLSLAQPDSLQRPASIGVATGAVDLRLRARDFPLAALAPVIPPEVISTLQGTLDADVHLTGSGDAPQGRGRMQLRNGSVALPELGASYHDLEIDGVLSGDHLSIERARLKSKKGELSIRGDVRFPSITRVEPDLRIVGDDFLFADTPDLRARATLDLHLRGTLTAPAVEGQITSTSSSYTVSDEIVSNLSRSTVELTPDDIRMMEETFGYQATQTASPIKALYDASALDLDVTLERDNWVRKRSGPRMAIEFAGQMHVRKPAHGELFLEGRLTPVPGRGYVEEFGRSFDVTGGEILLNGAMADHTAVIRTEYGVRSTRDMYRSASDRDVIVHLDVRTKGSELELKLSSEPSLTETEILTYIATGETPTSYASRTGSAGSDATAIATDIGLSQVTGALEDAAKGAVGLDVLRVRYDPQLGATVMAGTYLDPRVYVGIIQPVQYRTKAESRSQNPFQTTAEIEYQVLPWLSLDLQGEVNLLRFFGRARYAY